MYLANYTQLDIVFSVNLLARSSSALTRRHWNGIKHVLRYLRGTSDMGLFYSKTLEQQFFGYVDAGYLSNHHKQDIFYLWKYYNSLEISKTNNGCKHPFPVRPDWWVRTEIGGASQIHLSNMFHLDI